MAIYYFVYSLIADDTPFQQNRLNAKKEIVSKHDHPVGSNFVEMPFQHSPSSNPLHFISNVYLISCSAFGHRHASCRRRVISDGKEEVHYHYQWDNYPFFAEANPARSITL